MENAAWTIAGGAIASFLAMVKVTFAYMEKRDQSFLETNKYMVDKHEKEMGRIDSSIKDLVTHTREANKNMKGMGDIIKNSTRIQEELYKHMLATRPPDSTRVKA